MAFVKSLRRKHYTIFLVILVSVILKIQIVLSPGLFEPSRVQVTDLVTLNVLDSFEFTENITSSSILSYYFARSLQEFDLKPPFGVDAKCAYQTFNWLDKDGKRTRGAADSPVKAVVDAVFANMTCLHLESHNSSWEFRNNSAGVRMQETDIEFRFENCNQTVVVHESSRAIQNTLKRPRPDPTVSRTVLNNLSGRLCSSLPQQHSQFVYYSGACNPDATAFDIPSSEECAAILCSPMVWVSKVEVIDDGDEQKVSLLPSQDGYPIDVRTDLWDTLRRSIPYNYGGTEPPVDAAFTIRRLDIDHEGFIATNHGLEQAVQNLTDELVPLLAHHALRKPEESQIDGWRTTMTERLQMNRAVCLTMTSLFAVCTCIVLWTTLRSRRVIRFWHRDPATVLGMMLFFYSNSSASVSGKNTLSGGRERDKALWSNSGFTPLVLRPWLRIITVLYMLGLITALFVTLRTSQTSDGIATVNEERYSSLLWKSVPTLAVLLVSTFVSSSDAAVRGLMTLASMLEKPSHAWQLDLSLLDMLGLHSLYRSPRMRLPAIGLTQGLTVLCSFLAALSSVLFTAKSAPERTEARFEQSSWFGGASRRYNPNRDILDGALAAIGLTSGTGNLTYPPGTYGDLLFPGLALGNSTFDDAASIEVKTPAARVDHTCVELSNGTAMTLNILPGTRAGSSKPAVRFTESMICPPKALSNTSVTLADVTPERPYFGLVLKYHLCDMGRRSAHKALDIGKDRLWWTRSYAWGKVSDPGNGNLTVDYFAAWRCNFTWAGVDATVTLQPTDGDLRIDHSHPPVPDESTTRPWEPLFPVPVFVENYKKAELQKAMFPEGINTDPRVREFSAQMALLMEPVGPLQFQDLERDDRKGFVLDTINANTRLAMAQISNFEHRLGTNETSMTEPTEHGELSPVGGVVSRPRRRLFQNATVTYILVAILSAAVLVNVWALISSALKRYCTLSRTGGRWLLDLELSGVAPDGYSSVAIMEALLSGSNYGDILPEDAHLMAPDQLLRHLGDRRFQMGWFINKSTSEKVFTIGLVEDGSNSHSEVKERNQEGGAVQDRLLSTTHDNTN